MKLLCKATKMPCLSFNKENKNKENKIKKLPLT